MCHNSLDQSPIWRVGLFCFHRCHNNTQFPCTTAVHTCLCFTGCVPGRGSTSMWSVKVLIFIATLPSRHFTHFMFTPCSINFLPVLYGFYLFWLLPDSQWLLTSFFPVLPTLQPPWPPLRSFPWSMSSLSCLIWSPCSSSGAGIHLQCHLCQGGLPENPRSFPC